ncbi:hypothetical protein BJG93_31000 (plasmid) [Paraburkholderia sprentiae WSM5005]|uniref:Uncharacterized protein n=1 Tax=Paraburkholderia sprentiae WSM5005 TaxID=754502 RepID=A0A1I9YUL7_9BURK|nr:hypothetical protein [Paraburkholderia sprentiae]APA89879.1 hypothetical protein BJG93_31000 [Paraburkholderia sprentiae WSM5005]
MQQTPEPHKPDKPDKPDSQQTEIGSGTPPPRVPEAMPDTDRQPEQQPVRDTPDVRAPGPAPP